MAMTAHHRTTPTPNPSPQGGGEQTELAAPSSRHTTVAAPDQQTVIPSTGRRLRTRPPGGKHLHEDAAESPSARREHAMRIAAVFAVLAVLASPAALANVRLASIPEKLWGSWAASADGCGAGNKSVIVLSAKGYDSADAKCAVDWVNETAGPSGPIYSAHLRCASEPAQTPSATSLIIRLDDANQISVGPAFSSLKTYQKCPARPWARETGSLRESVNVSAGTNLDPSS
jgi:hypothetical protein